MADAAMVALRSLLAIGRLGVYWKRTDMHSRFSDWLVPNLKKHRVTLLNRLPTGEAGLGKCRTVPANYEFYIGPILVGLDC